MGLDVSLYRCSDRAAAKHAADEPAYWIAVDADVGMVPFGMSADDANGGQVARTEVNDWINANNEGAGFSIRLIAAYTRPQPASVEPMTATAGGRNMLYEGLFDGETESDRDARLAASMYGSPELAAKARAEHEAQQARLESGRLKALRRGLELARRWSNGTAVYGTHNDHVRAMGAELHDALSSQPDDYDPAPALTVTDEDVEAAMMSSGGYDGKFPWAERERLRAALESFAQRKVGDA